MVGLKDHFSRCILMHEEAFPLQRRSFVGTCNRFLPHAIMKPVQFFPPPCFHPVHAYLEGSPIQHSISYFIQHSTDLLLSKQAQGLCC